MKKKVWKFFNFSTAYPSFASSHWFWPDLDAPGCCFFSDDLILIVLIIVLLLQEFPETPERTQSRFVRCASSRLRPRTRTVTCRITWPGTISRTGSLLICQPRSPTSAPCRDVTTNTIRIGR